VVAFTALFDAGSRVAVATPGYPCYRNVLQALGCEVVKIPVTEESNWQPTPAMLQAAIDADGRPLDGLIVASPSNPTGTVLSPEGMKEICDFCTANKIRFISDEIYHGLSMREGARIASALEYKSDTVVINSFSKYFCMTGWRVGWIVCSDPAIKSALEVLLQNLFISAPTLSQLGAAAAFDCAEELDGHVARYRRNLKVLVDGLPQAGFDRVRPPDGAFYLYCDVTNFLRRTGTQDSLALCRRILDDTAVALTSGLDFDPDRGHKYVRFSYSGSTAAMEDAVGRLQRWSAALPP